MFHAQQWVDGSELRFDEVDLTGWSEVAFRFTATDALGNLAERRIVARPSSGAPTASLPSVTRRLVAQIDMALEALP